MVSLHTAVLVFFSVFAYARSNRPQNEYKEKMQPIAVIFLKDCTVSLVSSKRKSLQKPSHFKHFCNFYCYRQQCSKYFVVKKLAFPFEFILRFLCNRLLKQ